jgi:hypothetical protein
MKGFYSFATISWMKFRVAMKPLGDKSVFELRLSKKFMTVSPILILLIDAIKSLATVFLSFNAGFF